MKNRNVILIGLVFLGVVIYLKRQKDKKDESVAIKATKQGDSNFSSADCGCGA